MNNYDVEVNKRFGKTDAYKEYKQKSANYTEDKRQQINNGLNAVLGKFAECKKTYTSDSNRAQTLVKKLQDYITDNYYTCTNKILEGLGKMYVCDDRFKENINKNGKGTAEFISNAIEIYVK